MRKKCSTSLHSNIPIIYPPNHDVKLPQLFIVEVMRHAIALNGPFFNTQTILQQYVQKAYA